MLTEISHRRILCGLTSMWNLGGKNEDVELIEAEKKREEGKIGRRWSEGTNLWLWKINASRELMCRHVVPLPRWYLVANISDSADKEHVHYHRNFYRMALLYR